MTKEVSLDLLKLIVKAIDDKNGHDMIVFDQRGHSILSDYNIIVSGRSDRQVLAIAKAVSDIAHDEGLNVSVEGKSAAHWILVDLGDIIVHIFDPEARENYQLEKLWMDSSQVDVSDWLAS